MTLPAAQEELEPCPFCGTSLTIRSGVNSYGRCLTDGCWMSSRAMIVPFDDPRQVEEWNRRPTDIASRIVLAEPLTVTEEMVERAKAAFAASPADNYQNAMRAALTAALTPTQKEG